MQAMHVNDNSPAVTADFCTEKLTEDKSILTVAETARILGVSPKAIYALVKQPYTDFPSLKVGKRILISRELLYKWIQCECQKPSAEINRLRRAGVYATKGCRSCASYGRHSYKNFMFSIKK